MHMLNATHCQTQNYVAACLHDATCLPGHIVKCLILPAWPHRQMPHTTCLATSPNASYYLPGHIAKCLMLSPNVSCYQKFHATGPTLLTLCLNVLALRSSIYVYTLTSLLQIFRRLWYYVTVPMWWLLVVYAVLDLILIYTYQFDVVSEAWDRAYQQTNLNISSEDL